VKRPSWQPVGVHACVGLLLGSLIAFGCTPGGVATPPVARPPPVASSSAAAPAPAPTDAQVRDGLAVVRGQIHPGAKRCFQQGLDRGLRLAPGATGRIVIRLHVAPDGAVDTSTIASNDGMPGDVAACIAEVAKGARFEATGGAGATLSIPFNFVGGGDEGAQ
jgi:hypothetical protein